MTIMLLVALVCGWMARKLGQSRVIGEIIGGVLILIGVEDHGKEAQDLSVIEAA
jgi:Kef-type K+ transport system membrane component KefB